MFIERPVTTLPADRAERFVRQLSADLSVTDPDLFALGFQKVAVDWQDAGGPATFEPLALFGYRSLDERTGVAYAAAILETPRTIDLRKTMVLAIAHKARAAGHDRLFLITADHRLRAAFAAFGMRFPAELQLQSFLVGCFDLTTIAHAQAA